ncbi:MAG: hypothetical protein ABH828_00825 [archaeon]
MGKLGNFSWAVFAKLSLFTVALIAYVNHSELRKLDYNLFDGGQPIEKNFFNNPSGLEVNWETNDYGKNETYLLNSESKKKLPIYYDMLPTNQDMFSGLEKRANNGYSETAKFNDVYFIMNKGSMYIAHENDTLKVSPDIFKTEKSVPKKVMNYFNRIF